jgi:hypothetical protein
VDIANDGIKSDQARGNKGRKEEEKEERRKRGRNAKLKISGDYVAGLW